MELSTKLGWSIITFIFTAGFINWGATERGEWAIIFWSSLVTLGVFLIL